MNVFKLWMRAATPDEQESLAQALGTSRAYLYHWAADDDAKYKREPGAIQAAAIERLTEQMHKASNGRLPRVYRTDMVEACRLCAFAQKCLGAAAVRADFPIVTAQMVVESEGGHHD